MPSPSRKTPLRENDVTPEEIYLNRRKVLHYFGITAATMALPTTAQAAWPTFLGGSQTPANDSRHPLKFSKDPKGKEQGSLTPESKVLTHNNFYEFGTKKTDPERYAQELQTDPWHITIEGTVHKPMKISMDDILKAFPLEERIYRMRCVEGWSMIIPWLGFPLSKLLAMAKPMANANYVAFTTLHDPKQMRGQRYPVIGGGIPYPYVDGLRMDEANHPLTILSLGLYGKTLAPQNGAPIRLVVPWKYGFKSIKSIVKIRLTERQPPCTWNLAAPEEYGFYANVNPKVDHPRWSQATERVIGRGGILGSSREPTQPFNGYGEEVAGLYAGMDLTKDY